MRPDLVLRLTLISSNYPCLEHIFVVPKVFEPFRFYCTFLSELTSFRKDLGLPWCIKEGRMLFPVVKADRKTRRCILAPTINWKDEVAYKNAVPDMVQYPEASPSRRPACYPGKLKTPTTCYFNLYFVWRICLLFFFKKRVNISHSQI